MRHFTDQELHLDAQRPYGRLYPFYWKVRSETLLPACSKEVWVKLTHFADYEWNHFTPRIRTELREGAAVHLEVHGLSRQPMQRVEWLHSLVPERRLCWGMSLGPFLRANRSQWLIPQSDNTTLYRTEDEISGILAPIVRLLYQRKMQQGFDLVCSCLGKLYGTDNA
ncbi:MAG: SRPBCC domain-containing protein [Polyangiaceae bacterium]|nr:SRPBCC domain-containing protein [Polyangiaceae bacterium]